MTKWRAYLKPAKGAVQEFEFFAMSSKEAEERVTSIFPNVPFTLEKQI
jgi:hypothetical protein